MLRQLGTRSLDARCFGIRRCWGVESFGIDDEGIVDLASMRVGFLCAQVSARGTFRPGEASPGYFSLH